MPFEEYTVDLIGPGVVQVCDKPYEFNALTVINTVTNLVELIRVDDKTSDTITRRYAQCWLSRYPWPQRCVCWYQNAQIPITGNGHASMCIGITTRTGTCSYRYWDLYLVMHHYLHFLLF
jgi:hypothetical protein